MFFPWKLPTVHSSSARGGAHEPLPTLYQNVDWLDLVETITGTMNSWVQRSWHVQKTLFNSLWSSPLLLWWFFRFGGDGACVIDVPLVSEHSTTVLIFYSLTSCDFFVNHCPLILILSMNILEDFLHVRIVQMLLIFTSGRPSLNASGYPCFQKYPHGISCSHTFKLSQWDIGRHNVILKC